MNLARLFKALCARRSPASFVSASLVALAGCSNPAAARPPSTGDTPADLAAANAVRQELASSHQPPATAATTTAATTTAATTTAATTTAATTTTATFTAADEVPPLPPLPTDKLVPLFGTKAPTAFIAAAPSGHWAAVCEATSDVTGDGKLSVRLTQHGEFEGDPLRQVLYVSGTRLHIDEFAGSDPTGRYVAFVVGGELRLLDTNNHDTAILSEADTRATQASFQPLRSLTFSDDGRRLAYLRGTTTSILVVRDLARQTEQTFALARSPAYRVSFAPGARYVQIEAPVRDTNKNGRLDWLSPIRKGAAPCPSPIPTYSVWQFPGDEPDVSLFDVQTGKLSVPDGFVVAAGRFVLRRTDDSRLLADQPGKPTLAVSSKECNGRVLHVDAASGAVLFGCSSAWGQRRQMFLRTQDARVDLGFDLAAYEVDATLPTREPIVALYPGNRSVLLDVRTRALWPLLDGTHVLAVLGTTALIERELQLTVATLEPDAAVTPKTVPVKRTPFSAVLRQGSLVSVGPHVFDLAKRSYLGRYAAGDTPLALSHSAEGLFPVSAASPSELGTGPLVWHAPTHATPLAK